MLTILYGWKNVFSLNNMPKRAEDTMHQRIENLGCFITFYLLIRCRKGFPLNKRASRAVNTPW